MTLLTHKCMKLKTIYDDLEDSMSTFNHIIEKEHVFFLSEDTQVQCGNECKYACGGYKNNRQKGYDKKENFDKQRRKTNLKNSLGNISCRAKYQSIYNWTKQLT